MIGLGYIGLPTAATIASRGIDVIGVDINEDAVKLINEGKAHFAEPDLDILLQSTTQTGKLRATTTPEAADIFVIAVPTPLLADHTPDLSFVEAASRSVASVLQPGNLVILESTSPVGTTQRMCEWIAQERPDLNLPHADPDNCNINVAYCPERILPGQMLFELVSNDRILGGMTESCSSRACEFYELFVRGELHWTNAATAELVKLLENAYRDVNIALANEVSILCDQLDLDPWEAISFANRHPRVNILSPGSGVGGHCISVDPWFLISAASEQTPLMRTARQVNDIKPKVILAKIRKQLSRFRDPVIACLGLSYKPDVDDLRESPALDIVRELSNDRAAKILVVEPNLNELPATLSSQTDLELVDLKEAIEKADVIALLVGHKQFRKVDRRSIYERVIIDAAGLWQTRVRQADSR